MYEVYADQTGLYRWRFRAPSGDVLAQSGRGFQTRATTCRAVGEFKEAAVNPGETQGCERYPDERPVAQ